MCGMIIGDGMAEYSLKELSYLVPLKKVKLKNMDRLASFLWNSI